MFNFTSLISARRKVFRSPSSLSTKIQRGVKFWMLHFADDRARYSDEGFRSSSCSFPLHNGRFFRHQCLDFVLRRTFLLKVAGMNIRTLGLASPASSQPRNSISLQYPSSKS